MVVSCSTLFQFVQVIFNRSYVCFKYVSRVDFLMVFMLFVLAVFRIVLERFRHLCSFTLVGLRQL